MKVVQLYSQKRGVPGGEESLIELLRLILERHGHQTSALTRSSQGIESSKLRKVAAAMSGVFNPFAYRDMRRELRVQHPDIMHVHSVYPWFSPSVLMACRHEHVPVVLHVHSYTLTCPTTFHLWKGRVCEDCLGGHEYRCVLKNCRNNVLESCAYTLRSSVARRFRLFHDNVTLLIALTPFAKGGLLQAGFREDQIAVVPNPTSVKGTAPDRPAGEYVAFAGRISSEKGVNVLVTAAARMPDVPFKVAGDGPVLSEMMARAPRNVEFLGRLGLDDLLTFYRKSRILVVPSVFLEPFGMVVVDAMALGVPVIASRIGGLPHVVDDGITGCLFDPGSPEALVKDVRRLWEAPHLCDRMGRAGREKVMREYSQDKFYHNLMAVYQTAIQRSRNGAAVSPH